MTITDFPTTLEDEQITASSEGITEIDTSDLQRQLDNLASELAHVDAPARERVRTLSSDLREGRLAELSALEVRGFLDPDGIEERAALYYRDHPFYWRALAFFMSVLDWIRNFGVLIPITYTWYGLSQASATYRALIELKPELITRPFLLLWENGFAESGRFHGPTFSQVASFDFWVLAGLVVLTLVVHSWRELLHEYHEANAERKAGSLRRRVEQTVAQLGRVLAAEQHRQSPGTAALRIHEALEHFEAETHELFSMVSYERQRMEALVDRRERELGDLSLFSEGLTSSTENLVRYSQDVRQVYDRLERTAAALTGQVEKLGLQQAELNNSFSGVSSDAQALRDTLAFVSRNLDGAIAELKRSTVQSVGTLQAMTNASAEMSTAARKVVQAESSMNDSLSRVQASNVAITQNLGQATDRISSAADTTNRVLGAIETTSAHLAKLSEANSQLATSLGQVATRQTDLSGAAQQSLETVSKLAEGFREAVDTMGRELKRSTQEFKEFEQRWMRYLSQMERRTVTGEPPPVSWAWKGAAAAFGTLTVLELAGLLYLMFRVLTR